MAWPTATHTSVKILPTLHRSYPQRCNVERRPGHPEVPDSRSDLVPAIVSASLPMTGYLLDIDVFILRGEARRHSWMPVVLTNLVKAYISTSLAWASEVQDGARRLQLTQGFIPFSLTRHAKPELKNESPQSKASSIARPLYRSIVSRRSKQTQVHFVVVIIKMAKRLRR